MAARKVLLALGLAGLGAATAVGVWWWLRRKKSLNPGDFQKPFARVAKLYVYPVKSCHRIKVDTIECLIRGFKCDRFEISAFNTARAQLKNGLGEEALVVQAEFLNGTKNRTSGHVQFETCEVYHGVLVLFCRVSLSYSYIGHCPITFSA